MPETPQEPYDSPLVRAIFRAACITAGSPAAAAAALGEVVEYKPALGRLGDTMLARRVLHAARDRRPGTEAAHWARAFDAVSPDERDAWALRHAAALEPVVVARVLGVDEPAATAMVERTEGSLGAQRSTVLDAVAGLSPLEHTAVLDAALRRGRARQRRAAAVQFGLLLIAALLVGYAFFDIMQWEDDNAAQQAEIRAFSNPKPSAPPLDRPMPDPPRP